MTLEVGYFKVGRMFPPMYFMYVLDVDIIYIVNSKLLVRLYKFDSSYVVRWKD